MSALLMTTLAVEPPVRKSVPGEQLFAYMIERENIRRRKEAGEPGPWTDDPILREYSFTNVRRSDDRTTRKLMADFYGPNVAAISSSESIASASS